MTESSGGSDKESFLSGLLKKLSTVQQIESLTGRSTTAAQEEVSRQIHQVGKKQDGDPISGHGVTKSGPG